MKLLIPGPVTTDPRVREAAAQDYAPWDNDVRPLVAGIRERIVRLAGSREGEHATIPLQGCGHFGVEAAIRTFVPRPGKLLVPATGAYADRLGRLARELGVQVVALEVPETERADPARLEAALLADPAITHAALVYSETGSGVIHDVPALAAAAGRAGRRVIVDAVSAFGALPLDLSSLPMVDAAVFTPNKCLEALPGAAFIVARIDRLEACSGRAGSWSLDLADIYQNSLKVGWGSSRFTPAIQALAALDVALGLHEAEGREARLARYTANMRTLYEGVRGLGLTPYLPEAVQGPVVVNVHAPAHPAWSLQGFVDQVKTRGFVVSNFFNTKQPSFRVGCIGAITPKDMAAAVVAIGESLAAMGVALPRAA